jgi:hypothetical protein
MNERTKVLFDKALDQAVPETWTTLSHEQMTKLFSVFAESIVLECAKIADTAEPFLSSDLIKQHFGVEQ